jgi:hypothetical protein
MPSLNTGNAILSNPIKVETTAYNVGIGGAASSSFKLQVTGTTNLTGALNGTSATFSGDVTFGANNRGFIREPAGDVEIGGTAGAALKLYSNGVEYAKIAPSTGFTTTLPFGGTSATFSSSVTNVSALYVRASSNSDLPFINFSNADGAYNWGRIGGLLQGDGDGSLYFQTKLGGGLTTKLTIASTGAATFSSSVTAASLGIGLTASAKIQAEVGNTTSIGLFSASGLAITSGGGSTGNIYQIAFGYGGGTYGSSALYGLTESSTGYNTGALVFATRSATTDTAPIERMRITSIGTVDIKGDSNNVSGMNALTVRLGSNCDNTSSYGYVLETGGANRCFIYGNGNIVNANNSYGSLSDIKLKENIVDTTPKLDDLLKVKIRNYNLIGDDKKQLGVIAQELEEIFPSMIDETNDINKGGNNLGTTTKSVKYSIFVPMLIKAIQEQQLQIEELKLKIK